MTDDEQTRPVVWLPPRPRFDRTIKLLMAIALACASVSLLPLAFTSKSNADAIAKLADLTDTEKKQDACYDQYTADVTDGNADTLAAVAAAQGILGEIVTILFTLNQTDPAERPALIAHARDLVPRLATESQRASTASAAYDAAIAARKQYVAAGRPLPCTNTPN